MDLALRNRLNEIIEDSTKCNVILISHDTVTEFKSLVRGDNVMIEFSFKLLFEKLGNNHSQTRLLSLMLIDVLFRRSKYFRELTVNNLETLYELTLNINPRQALPSPHKTALYLHEQSLEFIEEWTQDFGQFYYRLKLGYNHLIKRYYLHFKNKRIKKKEKEKIKQKMFLKKRKQKLKRFIELINKFNQKYPKIIKFLNEFQLKLQKITPTFHSILQSVKNDNQCIGFSDDDDDDDDLNLELPASCDNKEMKYNDDFFNNFDFESSYRQYGLHNGYSIQITIDTNINNIINNKQRLNELSVYRYLTETKLKSMIEEWRNILINVELNIIINKRKELILINQKINILKKLDQIHNKITQLISNCNAFNIQPKRNKRKKTLNKITKQKDKGLKEELVKTIYVDVPMSSIRFDDEYKLKRHQIKQRLLKYRQKPSAAEQQKRRILFKRISKPTKKIKGQKYSFKSQINKLII